MEPCMTIARATDTLPDTRRRRGLSRRALITGGLGAVGYGFA